MDKPVREIYVATDYKILYEDEYFLAVDKPSPLPVHQVGSYKEKNLLSILEKDGWGDCLSIANRLDAETSGIVLVPRTTLAARLLGKMMMAREIHKEYTAIVFGELPNEKGVVNIPLGVELKKVHYATVADSSGQEAVTEYECIAKKNEYSLVKLIPKTGRTHQLRVHMALLGNPLVGDKLYIDDAIFEQYIGGGWQESMMPTVHLRRLALHAGRTSFRHFAFDATMDIVSKLPLELQTFWDNQK